MSPEKRNHRIPDVVLEQYLLGALSESERVETERALKEDEEVRNRLAALQQSNRDILKQYPPELIAQKIHAKFAEDYGSMSTKLTFLRPVKLSMGIAAAVILLFVFLPRAHWEFREPQTIERLKGEGPTLKLYRKTAEGSEVLEDGAMAFQGDVLRIGYQTAGRKYGVIVSVDGRGLVTQHWPENGNLSGLLKQGGQAFLSFAIELDDAPHWERFYFVTRNTPFSVDLVLQATGQISIEASVDQFRKLELPEEFDQFAVFLEKGVRR